MVGKKGQGQRRLQRVGGLSRSKLVGEMEHSTARQQRPKPLEHDPEVPTASGVLHAK